MKTWTNSLKNTVFIKKAYIRRIFVSFIITFVLSRIVFPSGMMPFAPALVAAAFSKKTFFDPAFAFIGCILGIFLSFGGFSPVYLFILVVD